MNKEIKELDMNKYLVLKWEDIQNADLEVKEKLAFVEGYIGAERHKNGKKDNKYLVLNLDDEINLNCLRRAIDKKQAFVPIYACKVKDIAVYLVNAILKTKE